MSRSDQTDITRAAGAATIGAGAPALIVGVSRVRRTGAAFFLGDAAFLSDARFRKLARRLPEPDEFNAAVGAWFIALAAARRNGKPELDVEAETGSRFLDDLRAVGLLTDTGFRPEPFEAWAPKAPQQSIAGQARAASAERVGGRFAPAETSEHQQNQRAGNGIQQTPASIPLHSSLINSPSEEGGSGETDDLDSLTVFLAQHGAFIRPDAPLGIRLAQLVDRRGIEAVMAEAEALAQRGERLSDRQWVLGLENRIEAIPTLRAVATEAEADLADNRAKRRDAAVMERRLEAWRNGVWHDEWGPQPEAAS